jgi:hypothetical protein
MDEQIDLARHRRKIPAGVAENAKPDRWAHILSS